MNKVRFLPIAVGLLVLGALIAVRFVTLYQPHPVANPVARDSAAPIAPVEQAAPREDPAVAVHAPERPAQRPPRPLVDGWEVADERDLTLTTGTPAALAPYYSTNASMLTPEQNAVQAPLSLALEGKNDAERHLALSAQTPHAVRWEITFRAPGEYLNFQVSEQGFYITTPDYQNSIPPRWRFTEDHTMTLERTGTRLSYMLPGYAQGVVTVPENDRTPLRAGSDARALYITHLRLLFKPGEDLQVAPAAPAAQSVATARGNPARAAQDAKWEKAFETKFSQRTDLQPFTCIDYRGMGSFDCGDSQPSFLLKNSPGMSGEVYAALHKSLPGDLRIRFQAQPPEGESQVCIATIFSVAGAIRKEDGYFAEWADGRVKLKKRNHLVADADAPTPKTDSRWVNLELRKRGGAITLYTEGKKVLEWTDNHPLRDAAHDLFSFYIWNKEAQLRNLVIERNANDTVKPLDDDPAADDNLYEGKRTLPPGAVAPAETSSGTQTAPGPTSDF